MKRHRILLVEDNTLFRQALRLMLAQCGDIEVVGEAGNGIEAVEMYTLHKPDLVLMGPFPARSFRRAGHSEDQVPRPPGQDPGTHGAWDRR